MRAILAMVTLLACCLTAAEGHAVVLRNAGAETVTVRLESMNRAWDITLPPGERYRDYTPGVTIALPGKTPVLTTDARDEYMVLHNTIYPERYRHGGRN